MTASELERRALALLGLSAGPLLLASGSPRRRELLARIGVPLVVAASNVPEGDRTADESPRDYVIRLARDKAGASMDRARTARAHAILGADTIVELDGEVLEKPVDAAEADAMLARLSGRWHRVWTGVAVIRVADARLVQDAQSSRVRFAELSADDRRLYVETGEPLDKAGAYGIQGIGGLFIPEIDGDYFNVMGLPLALLRRLCRELEGQPPESVER